MQFRLHPRIDDRSVNLTREGYPLGSVQGDWTGFTRGAPSPCDQSLLELGVPASPTPPPPRHPKPTRASAPSSPSVSLCKCVWQAQARHATTLPAGQHVDLRFCRGFDGKLGRRSQNHLSPPSLRLRTAAAHRLDRRLPLNAARARQPVDRGTRRRHTLAAGMGVKAAMPLLHHRGYAVVGRLNVARYGKRVERVHGPGAVEQVPIFITGQVAEPGHRLDLKRRRADKARRLAAGKIALEMQNGLFVALALGVGVGPMPKNVSKHGANHSRCESPSTRRAINAAVMGLSKRLGRARKAQLRRWFNGRLERPCSRRTHLRARIPSRWTPRE